jgi:hypothetical protein
MARHDPGGLPLERLEGGFLAGMDPEGDDEGEAARHVEPVHLEGPLAITITSP